MKIQFAFFSTILFGLLFLIPTLVTASTINFNPDVRGHVIDDGTLYSSTGNYAAGNDNGDREFRSFFVFDLSALSGQNITSASFSLFLPDTGYSSSDLDETFVLYDVLSTNISSLRGDTPSNAGVHDDLGTGDSYGSAIISESDENSFINITLGIEALFDLNNSLGGDFAIAGSVTSLSSGAGVQEVIFVNTQMMDMSNTFLSLETTPIPEPSTMFLFGSCLLGLAGVSRRKK